MTLDADGRYEVGADERTDRLYITLSGLLAPEEIETAADMAVEAARSLDPEFIIATTSRDSGRRTPRPQRRSRRPSSPSPR